MKSIDGVECGTIMLLKNKIAAVIELKDKSKQGQIRKLIREKNPELDDCIFINEIPKDPRHNSKIDYEKLLKKVSRKLTDVV